MSEFNRTTRECPVNQLHPEVFRELKNYFQEKNLGDLETETVSCCETVSTKNRSGGLFSLLSPSVDTTIHTGVVLTSQWLVWVRSGDKSGTLLSAANLNNISVSMYKSMFVNDTGLEIIGYIGDSKLVIRGYVGMGPEPATQKFCDEVKQAITTLNPPKPRTWPKWMGG
ncbi:MAG: hypothetical protein U0V02_21315 [Anaerolineales bacterium]